MFANTHTHTAEVQFEQALFSGSSTLVLHILSDVRVSRKTSGNILCASICLFFHSCVRLHIVGNFHETLIAACGFIMEFFFIVVAANLTFMLKKVNREHLLRSTVPPACFVSREVRAYNNCVRRQGGKVDHNLLTDGQQSFSLPLSLSDVQLKVALSHHNTTPCRVKILAMSTKISREGPDRPVAYHVIR